MLVGEEGEEGLVVGREEVEEAVAAGFEVVYARVVSTLLSSGTPIPLMDALIGTLALQCSQAVVTREVEHFRRIPRLVVHDHREP